MWKSCWFSVVQQSILIFVIASSWLNRALTLKSVPCMLSSSFMPETYAFDTLERSRSGEVQSCGKAWIWKQNTNSLWNTVHRVCGYYELHIRINGPAKRTIRQQYERMNQSIFQSSFLSTFEEGISPHTNSLTCWRPFIIMILGGGSMSLCALPEYPWSGIFVQIEGLYTVELLLDEREHSRYVFNIVGHRQLTDASDVARCRLESRQSDAGPFGKRAVFSSYLSPHPRFYELFHPETTLLFASYKPSCARTCQPHTMLHTPNRTSSTYSVSPEALHLGTHQHWSTPFPKLSVNSRQRFWANAAPFPPEDDWIVCRPHLWQCSFSSFEWHAKFC